MKASSNPNFVYKHRLQALFLQYSDSLPSSQRTNCFMVFQPSSLSPCLGSRSWRSPKIPVFCMGLGPPWTGSLSTVTLLPGTNGLRQECGWQGEQSSLCYQGSAPTPTSSQHITLPIFLLPIWYSHFCYFLFPCFSSPNIFSPHFHIHQDSSQILPPL